MILDENLVKKKVDGKVKEEDVKLLDFSKCKISSISDTMSICANLRKLNLSHNALTDDKSLTALRDLPALVWLDLSNNSLVDIDNICRIKTLNVLNVSYNKLTTLPARMGTMNVLQALIASDNMLTSIQELPQSLDTIVVSRNRIKTFSDKLTVCRSLKKLSATNNLLKSVPDLSGCPMLRELRLNDNMISSLSGMHISKCMIILELARNIIEGLPEDDEDESFGFGKAPYLRTLNLGSNPICKQENLTKEIIAKACPKLKNVDFRI